MHKVYKKDFNVKPTVKRDDDPRLAAEFLRHYFQSVRADRTVQMPRVTESTASYLVYEKGDSPGRHDGKMQLFRDCFLLFFTSNYN